MTVDSGIVALLATLRGTATPAQHRAVAEAFGVPQPSGSGNDAARSDVSPHLQEVAASQLEAMHDLNLKLRDELGSILMRAVKAELALARTGRHVQAPGTGAP